MSNIITKVDIVRIDVITNKKYIHIPKFTKGKIVNMFNDISSEIKFPNFDLPVLISNKDIIKLK